MRACGVGVTVSVGLGRKHRTDWIDPMAAKPTSVTTASTGSRMIKGTWEHCLSTAGSAFHCPALEMRLPSYSSHPISTLNFPSPTFKKLTL